MNIPRPLHKSFPLLVAALVSATFLLATAACSRGDEGSGALQEPIIGGREANPGEYPSMALLVVHQGLGSDAPTRCGCTLYARSPSEPIRFCITAAHCVLSSSPPPAGDSGLRAIPPENISIIAGALYIAANYLIAEPTPPARRVSALRTIVFPAVDRRTIAVRNDIALIELAEAIDPVPGLIESVPGVTSAAVEANLLKAAGVQSGEVVGWGMTQVINPLQPPDATAYIPGPLKTRRLDVLDDSACIQRQPFTLVDIDWSTTICAMSDTPDTGICYGDSGGPLLMRDVSGKPWLSGIVAAVGTDCSGGFYEGPFGNGRWSGYTRLANFSSWLDICTQHPANPCLCPRLAYVGEPTCDIHMDPTCNVIGGRPNECDPGDFPAAPDGGPTTFFFSEPTRVMASTNLYPSNPLYGWETPSALGTIPAFTPVSVQIRDTTEACGASAWPRSTLTFTYQGIPIHVDLRSEPRNCGACTFGVCSGEAQGRRYWFQPVTESYSGW